jgi:hypothetical protein
MIIKDIEVSKAIVLYYGLFYPLIAGVEGDYCM